MTSERVWPGQLTFTGWFSSRGSICPAQLRQRCVQYARRQRGLSHSALVCIPLTPHLSSQQRAHCTQMRYDANSSALLQLRLCTTATHLCYCIQVMPHLRYCNSSALLQTHMHTVLRLCTAATCNLRAVLYCFALFVFRIGDGCQHQFNCPRHPPSSTELLCLTQGSFFEFRL